MNDLTGAERLARRSRAVTISALALLTLLAWAWLLRGAGMPSAMPMEGMTQPALAWDAGRFLLIASMWWVMMIAMMLPIAAPVILLYGRVHRYSGDAPSTAPFLAGYLAIWLGFALIAASLQGLLEQRGLVSATTMTLPNGWASAGFLIAAGIYQLSSLKDACLFYCRMPSDFLTRHYRPGRWGAWRMGLIHGAYCVGCCWLLIALLFVGGVMNLVWIAALTLLIAAEKLLPGGPWIARLSGAVLILWGAAKLLA
jgi:predicted metal-binding membrane protein